MHPMPLSFFPSRRARTSVAAVLPQPTFCDSFRRGRHTKTHRSFKIIARALLPAFIYLALKTTHHTADARRGAFLPLSPAREQTLLARLFFFFSLVLWATPIPSAVKKEAARNSNKKSPPPQNDTLFSSLLRERGKIIENK